MFNFLKKQKNNLAVSSRNVGTLYDNANSGHSTRRTIYFLKDYNIEITEFQEAQISWKWSTKEEKEVCHFTLVWNEQRESVVAIRNNFAAEITPRLSLSMLESRSCVYLCSKRVTLPEPKPMSQHWPTKPEMLSMICWNLLFIPWHLLIIFSRR